MTPSARADRLRQRINRPTAVDPDALTTHAATPETEPVEPATPSPEPDPNPVAEAKATPEPVRRPAPRRATRRPGTTKPTGPVLNALEDPDITPGRKDYRSFYVDDAVFARFRAAIHWSSRNPAATDEVPENMSAAAEEWMLEVASDLEQRFNEGVVFRMPPATKRRGRKPGKSGL